MPQNTIDKEQEKDAWMRKHLGIEPDCKKTTDDCHLNCCDVWCEGDHCPNCGPDI